MQKGFTIFKKEPTFWEIEVTSLGLVQKKDFSLFDCGRKWESPLLETLNAVIQLPLAKVILTSTTQIPHFENLLGMR